jgi:hypothetical protein
MMTVNGFKAQKNFAMPCHGLLPHLGSKYEQHGQI